MAYARVTELPIGVALETLHLMTQTLYQTKKIHVITSVLLKSMFGVNYIIVDEALPEKSYLYHCQIGVNT